MKRNEIEKSLLFIMRSLHFGRDDKTKLPMKKQSQKKPVIESFLVFTKKVWQSFEMKLKLNRLLHHSFLIPRNAMTD